MTPRRRIIPLFIPHLGCPNDCVFCNQRKISGAAVPVTAQDVIRTIETALTGLPDGESAEAAFYGGSFTAIPVEAQEALLSAALPFLRTGKLSAIRLSTRPDCVDAQALERLRRYGVQTVELGAQSMDDAVLDLSGRGHTAADTERAAALVKAGGFSLIIQMMTGLPGDRPEKTLDTAKRIAALKPDGVRIYPTVVLRGTKLAEMAASGEYKPQSVEEAAALGAQLLALFDAAKIPVIRFGLNPTDALSGGEAVSGPYHPALGELARSRLYLTRARQLLEGIHTGAAVTLGVGKGKTSLMAGQKRGNTETLLREFGLKTLKIRECALSEDEYVRLLDIKSGN